MRSFFFCNILAIIFVSALALFDFSSDLYSNGYSLPKNFNHYELDRTCLVELRKQMNMEKQASLIYKQMAFYFSSINVTRPGFAKLFEQQSQEEMEHFDKFIKYINLRGAHIGTFNITMPLKSTWYGTIDAIEDAIELEHNVTNEIFRLYRIAEKSCNDIHLMNFLETNFFDEQINSINKLMKLMNLLKSFDSQHYGDYLIDRDLLHGKLTLDEL